MAEGWVRARAMRGPVEMEALMRRAVIYVRLVNQVRLLEALPADELTAVIDAEFRRAWTALLRAG